MNRKKIVIDTDIGDDIDDAFALALALASPELELLGVTTVYKNTRQRAHIVSALLHACGRRDIPVFAGLNFPLREEICKFDYEAMGENGLVDLRHYDAEMEGFSYTSEKAVEFILDTADRYPDQVTLVGIGPLTNLAAALKKRPGSFHKLKELVLMNGFFAQSYPEWNVMCDPEASRAVYTCGVPVRAIGANCTLRTEIVGEDLEKLRALGGRTGRLLNKMLSVWLEDNKRNCIMHDALTVACLYEDFVSFETRNVYLPLEEGIRGYTLCTDGETPVCGKASVSVAVNEKAFVRSFIGRLASFTQRETLRSEKFENIKFMEGETL